MIDWLRRIRASGISDPVDRIADANLDVIVPALQAQLTLASNNVDSVDRKAVLIPPFLVTFAGLVIGPEVPYKPIGIVFLLIAFAFGSIAIYRVVRVVFPGLVRIGPNAEATARATTLEPLQLRKEIALELAGAIEWHSVTSIQKSRAIVSPLRFAGLAIMFLLAARLLGVQPPMTDNSTPTPSVSPAASSAPSGTPSPSPSPSAVPSIAPSVAPSPSPVGAVPEPAITTSLGSQWMTKGGPVPSDVGAAIISTGGGLTTKLSQQVLRSLSPAPPPKKG